MLLFVYLIFLNWLNIFVLTACVVQRHEVMSKGPLVGAFVPQCESDGSFKATQCHGMLPRRIVTDI